MNFEPTVRKNLPFGIIQPRRGQVYVGFQCHQGCGFCYYKSKCHEMMFDFDVIKRQIDFEYEYGIKDFEITGGEPSEYHKLRDVCEYIKTKDENSKIAVITNGGLFASNVWDIINEVLISYHLNKNPKEYDRNMFPKGTTYDKVVKCIERARENNVFIRTNTVVGTFNLDNLMDIVEDLICFHPKIINFLPVNLFDESASMMNYIDYSKLRAILKKQIDIIEEKLPKTLVFVRYMPFCDMEGYEHHIIGHLQHIYDWFDWNVELDGVSVIEMSKKNPREVLGLYGSKSFQTCFDHRSILYEKDRRCMLCKYNIICDGVERTGGKLLSQIQPTIGKVVKNPLEFVGNTTERLYRKLYFND